MPDEVVDGGFLERERRRTYRCYDQMTASTLCWRCGDAVRVRMPARIRPLIGSTALVDERRFRVRRLLGRIVIADDGGHRVAGVGFAPSPLPRSASVGHLRLLSEIVRAQNTYSAAAGLHLRSEDGTVVGGVGWSGFSVSEAGEALGAPLLVVLAVIVAHLRGRFGQRFDFELYRRSPGP